MNSSHCVCRIVLLFIEMLIVIVFCRLYLDSRIGLVCITCVDVCELCIGL